MPLSERDDYDDTPSQTTASNVDPILKQAGTYWMIFWAWFLVPFGNGSVIFIIREGHRIDACGLVLILAVLCLTGAAFIGSRNMRNGSEISLPALSIGSSLFGLVVGGLGIFLGLQVIPNEHNQPKLIEQIQHGAALVWSLVFVLIGTNAAYLTLRYRKIKIRCSCKGYPDAQARVD